MVGSLSLENILWHNKKRWVPLPGNPDTFQFVEAQCGEAEDITGCIEEKTFNQSAIIKNVILGYTSQTSLIDQELGTQDFTSTFHGMTHTINIDTKINPDDTTTQLFIIFTSNSNYQVYIQNTVHMTKNRLMVAFDSNKGPNLKVVKWS